MVTANKKNLEVYVPGLNQEHQHAIEKYARNANQLIFDEPMPFGELLSSIAWVWKFGSASFILAQKGEDDGTVVHWVHCYFPQGTPSLEQLRKLQAVAGMLGADYLAGEVVPRTKPIAEALGWTRIKDNIYAGKVEEIE